MIEKGLRISAALFFGGLLAAAQVFTRPPREFRFTPFTPILVPHATPLGVFLYGKPLFAPVCRHTLLMSARHSLSALPLGAVVTTVFLRPALNSPEPSEARTIVPHLESLRTPLGVFFYGLRIILTNAARRSLFPHLKMFAKEGRSAVERTAKETV